MVSNSDKKASKRRGVMVFIALAVLTGVEFWVAVGGLNGTLPLLAVVATGKTALIAEYYMHLRSVTEEGGH
ncbi:MAG: cytochrome C oxidase subunit IV family protein [Anaerolineales bacterium]